MFHPYWRKDGDGWQEEDIVRHGNKVAVIGPINEEDGYDENNNREKDDESTRKAARISRLLSQFFATVGLRRTKFTYALFQKMF